jgi:hypothetical protein
LPETFQASKDHRQGVAQPLRIPTKVNSALAYIVGVAGNCWNISFALVDLGNF